MRSYMDSVPLGIRSGVSKKSLYFPLATLALAASAFAFVIHANYPGYIHPDNVVQLTQIYDGKIDDWHSPFVKFFWSGLLYIFPGQVGFLVLDNVLIWGAAVILAVSLYRRIGALSILALAIPVLPGTFNFLGHAIVDAQLAGWLLLSAASAYQVHRVDLPRGAHRFWLIAAHAFIICGFLTRSNVIFALAPLLLYTNYRLGWKRNVLACVVLLLLMPGIQSLQNRLLGVQPSYVLDSVKTYHLVALSHITKRNLFPGTWAPEENRAISDYCYSPVQFDSTWYGDCRFVYQGLRRQGLWGSADMTKAWLSSLAGHPRSAFSGMAATFWRSLYRPNSPDMLFSVKNDRFGWQPTPPFRWSTLLARGYSGSKFNHWFSRPAVFIFITFPLVLFLLYRRLAETNLGLFALALMMSGALYTLTYLPFNVSAEYRYFYWSGFAAYMGLFFTLFAYLEQRRGEVELAVALPTLVRLCVCTLIGAGVSLALVPMTLPTERRVVVVTPKTDGVLAVSSVKTASIPPWMGIRFEAQPLGAGWRWKDNAWRATVGPGTGPLVAVIETLQQSVRLEFETSKDGAVAQVQDGWGARTVDTRGAGDTLRIDLPPPEHGRDRGIHRDRIAILGLLFVALSTLLFLITGRWRDSLARLLTGYGRTRDVGAVRGLS